MKNITLSKLVSLLCALYLAYFILELPIIPISILDNIFSVCVAILAYLILSTILLGPIGPLTIRQNLARAGLTNRLGEPPFLLRSKRSDNIPNGITLEFMNCGIPREDFEAKKAELEAALNIFIVWIGDGRNRRRVIIDAVPADQGLPEFIPWSDRYLINDGVSVCLGVGLCGPVVARWDVVPHMLIGGSTGSGKSVLTRSIIYQCLRNGFTVQCIDAKGLDYLHFRHPRFHLLTESDACLKKLKEYVDELHRREDILKYAHCTSLDEYNSKNPLHRHSRVLIAFDEVAEVLDKTGRSREDKDLIDQITGCLMTIARTGRAVGIHLLLSQQRPDANVLPGQIKNNCTTKICGRADLTLSQIILDNGDAHDRIPSNARGLFLASGTETSELTLFRGFYFDPASLDADDWAAISTYIADSSPEEDNEYMF